MPHAYDGYREYVVALADWGSCGLNMPVNNEDGVLTHEDTMG